MDYMVVLSDTKKKVGVYIATVLLVMSAYFVCSSRVAFAAKNDGGMSLYNTAAGAAVYLDMMLHSHQEETLNASDDVSPRGTVARISGAMGYADLEALNTETLGVATVEEPEGWSAILTPNTAKNACVYSYNGFEKYGEVGKAIKQYGLYGHSLESLGIDQVAMGDGIVDPKRMVIGGALNGLYFVSSGTDRLMQGIVKAMQFTNPFRLFGNLVGEDDWKMENEINTGSMSKDGGAGWSRNDASITVTDNEAFKDEKTVKEASSIFEVKGVGEIARTLLTVYRWMYAVSAFVLIPLTVAITVAGYMIGRASFGSNSALAPKFKRYVLRMAFLVGGIPLMGMAYTATLDKLSKSIDEGSMSGGYELTDVIMHSFVDFGSWAENTNLAIPEQDGVALKVDENGVIDADTYSNLDQLIYAINKAGLGSTKENKSAFSNLGDTEYKYGFWIDEKESSELSSGKAASKKHNLVTQMLNSYMRGEVYSGAEYEGHLNSLILTETADIDPNKIYQWLRTCANPETYAKGLSTLPGKEGDDEVNLEVKGILNGNPASYQMSIKSRDELSELYDKLKSAADGEDRQKLIEEIEAILEDEEEAKVDSGAEDKEINITNHFFGNGTLVVAGDSYMATDGVGLSDVGMYNYLNTKFGTTGFSVYSGTNSVTTQSHPSHYRVNLAGGGVLGILMASNAALLLTAVAVTGIVYGLGLLFSSIKRSFSLIISLPLAFSGMIRSIAHTLLLAAALICEILGTLFAYELMKSLLIGLNQMINEGVAATWLRDLLGGSAGVLGLPFAIIKYLVACVFLVMYIIMAIRLRVAITNGLTDLVASILSRVTDVNPGDATSSSSGFGDAVLTGMVRNPVGSAIGLGVTGAAVTGGLQSLGVGGDAEAGDGIALGGDALSDASGGEGGLGADGGSSMLTGAYASEGSIEGGDRQGSVIAGAAIGSDAFADASSLSDAYGASAHSGDMFGADGSVARAYGASGYGRGGDGLGGEGEAGATGANGLASAYADSAGIGGEGGSGGAGLGGEAVGGAGGMRDAVAGESALASATSVGGPGFGADAYGYGGDGSTNVNGASLSAAAYSTGGTGGAGVGAGGGEGGDGSANVGGSNLSTAAYSTGGTGGAGVGAGGGEGGDGSANIGGASIAAAAYSSGGTGGAGVGSGGDGSANVGGSNLSAAAYSTGGTGGAGVGAGGGTGGIGHGGTATAGDATADAAGGGGGRGIATGGTGGYGYGGDGSALSSGGASLASSVGGTGGYGTGGQGVGGQGGEGGRGQFRGSGGAYDRDLGASDANVHVDSRADGLRNVQVASLASTLAGQGGQGGAVMPGQGGELRGVSGNVDLGASVAHFGSGKLAPNAPGAAGGSTERIREVRGSSGNGGGSTLAGAVHASSASIGSAHSDSTVGGAVTSQGGVSARGESRRDVRGSASPLSSSVGIAGRGGASGAPGASGGIGGAGTAGVGAGGGSGVGTPGAPGAPSGAGMAGVGSGAGNGGASGGYGIEGGLRGPRATTQSGPMHVNVAPLSAATGRGGTAVAGRGGTGGTSRNVHGSSRTGSSSVAAGSHVAHNTNVVGVGASAAPSGSSGGSVADRASRASAGSAERFSRAMSGNKGSYKPTKRSGSTTRSNLGDAVSGSKGTTTPSKGVDTGSFSSRDPFGRA